MKKWLNTCHCKTRKCYKCINFFAENLGLHGRISSIMSKREVQLSLFHGYVCKSACLDPDIFKLIPGKWAHGIHFIESCGGPRAVVNVMVKIRNWGPFENRCPVVWTYSQSLDWLCLPSLCWKQMGPHIWINLWTYHRYIKDVMFYVVYL